MEKRTVLSPMYMKEFSCIGSECEDTCCSGWQITIDKKTYNKYAELQEVTDKPSIIQHLQKLESGRCSENYSEIKLNEDSFCPFLNEEKLCGIQLQRGEEYLSNLCVTYPRVTNIVNGQYERSTTVSCPEAARVVLLNPDGIQFTEIEESVNERHLVVQKVSNKEQKTGVLQQAFLQEIRSFSIQILQNQNYSLSERLSILGLLVEVIRENVVSETQERIPSVISAYKKQLEHGTILQHRPSAPIDVRRQMEVLRRLIDMRLFAGVKDKRYLQCLMESLEGIQYTGDTLTDRSIELYRQSYEHLFVPFVSEYEYVLENYLVNYTFKNVFLLKRDSVEDYMLLVVHYALIKLHLIGMMGYHGNAFTIEHVIKLIQSFSRTVEHAPGELNRFLGFLKEKYGSNWESMMILIDQ